MCGLLLGGVQSKGEVITTTVTENDDENEEANERINDLLDQCPGNVTLML